MWGDPLAGETVLVQVRDRGDCEMERRGLEIVWTRGKEKGCQG